MKYEEKILSKVPNQTYLTAQEKYFRMSYIPERKKQKTNVEVKTTETQTDGNYDSYYEDWDLDPDFDVDIYGPYEPVTPEDRIRREHDEKVYTERREFVIGTGKCIL